MTTAPVPATAGPYRVVDKLGTETTDGLVIACSDRRFRRPTEHFLFKHLGLGNYDLIAVPGGVYMLAFPDVLPKQLKVGLRMVKFLMKSHLPPRIVLIAHQDCGRYLDGFASRLGRQGFSLAGRQKEDLGSACAQLGELFPTAQVEAFFAAVTEGDAVEFQPL